MGQILFMKKYYFKNISRNLSMTIISIFLHFFFQVNPELLNIY